MMDRDAIFSALIFGGGDTYTKSEIDAALALKVNNSTLRFYATESELASGLATKADKTVATTSANGLMSAEDKTHLDAVYADYSSALTALGVSE